MTLRRLVLSCLIAAIAASACTSVPAPAERRQSAEQMAADAGMTPMTLVTGRFELYALTRENAPSDLLVIYIEGDGFAWARRNRRSSDPTPADPLALALAVADSAPAVAWLARPCQFTGGERARNCDSDLWTVARYGEEVVAAMNDAIGTLKKKAGATQLGLVGYSGGGAIAALVAMRRSDVSWLKTVAAPLDTGAFTAFHKVSPMTGSLNPADHAARLARVAQIHYVGTADEIVPETINLSFLDRMGDTSCARLVALPGMGHHGDWASEWATLGRETPVCR